VSGHPGFCASARGRAYHAGALNGSSGDGRLTTVFYYVYLDRGPVCRQETTDDPFEVPVRPEVFVSARSKRAPVAPLPSQGEHGRRQHQTGGTQRRGATMT
jgi:hypothetical protein